MSFSGTVLEERRQAPVFHLTDQFDNLASLEQHNEGRVVVLTFLYTYCPDICPVVAHHIKSVHELLGESVEEVSIVIVSVDPDRDTVKRAREYSEDWGMVENWAFLVGSVDELSPVWESYHVSAAVDETARGGEVPEAWRGGEVHGVDALRRDIATRYTVTHQAPVYLIDKQARIRILHTLPIDPEEVVADIRALLEENASESYREEAR